MSRFKNFFKNRLRKKQPVELEEPEYLKTLRENLIRGRDFENPSMLAESSSSAGFDDFEIRFSVEDSQIRPAPNVKTRPQRPVGPPPWATQPPSANSPAPFIGVTKSPQIEIPSFSVEEQALDEDSSVDERSE